MLPVEQPSDRNTPREGLCAHLNGKREALTGGVRNVGDYSRSELVEHEGVQLPHAGIDHAEAWRLRGTAPEESGKMGYYMSSWR